MLDRGLDAPDLTSAKNREDVLTICGSTYLSGGLSSLKSLQDSSVDLIFSHAVLEHVRRHEFAETMCECHRILKPDGIATHRVDLRDHLGGGLNNLRFSRKRWESDFFVRSGFYTNRIRFSEMIKLMQEASFHVEVLNLRRWEKSPIRRKSLSDDFKYVTDEDLLVKGFDVLMRPV